MNMYFTSLLNVFPKNMMLLMISAVLAPLTFGYWFGIPFYFIFPIVESFTSNLLFSMLVANFSVALLISLFILPYHLKIADEFKHRYDKGKWKSFIQIQGGFILAVFLLLSIVCKHTQTYRYIYNQQNNWYTKID